MIKSDEVFKQPQIEFRQIEALGVLTIYIFTHHFKVQFYNLNSLTV
jgi:hypothetical protein